MAIAPSSTTRMRASAIRRCSWKAAACSGCFPSSLHSFFFFMGQTIGPVAYGLGLGHAGKVPTLLSAAVVMIALGFVCARLLRQRAPADAAARTARADRAIKY